MSVALIALANLCGLPSLLFTLLWLSMATNFQIVVFHYTPLIVASLFIRCVGLSDTIQNKAQMLGEVFFSNRKTA